MPRFFIDRPIFAWVIALFILVMGGVSVKLLPVAQYPTVAPPSISVSAVYPGASAQTLEDSVISVIEQEMNGSPGLIYMESVSAGQRLGTDHAHLRDRHRPRAGAGRRAKPPEPRRAAPAGGGDAAGRARRQGAQQLPAVHDPVVERPGRSTRWRWATTRRATCCPRSSASPASARRCCSAPSARCASGSTRPSWSAIGLSASDVNNAIRGAERAGVVRHDGRPADRAGPADQRHRGRQRPARQRRGVRRHRAARQHRRLDGAAARRGAHRTRRPELRHLGAPERQPLHRHRRAAVAHRQCAGHRHRGAPAHDRAVALLPAGHEVRHPVRQLALHPDLDLPGGRDAARGDGRWCSW